MSHPSDHRWGLEAPDYRPSIAVIEPPAGTRRAQPQGRVNRVPFGFARELVDTGACGLPHPRNAKLGGCIKPLGHPPGHQWRPGDPAPIRPEHAPELHVKP